MPGPRGLTVLVLAGAIGLCFAIIGWTQRDTGLVTPAVPSSHAAAHLHRASHSGAQRAAGAGRSASPAHIAAAARPGNVAVHVYTVSGHGQAAL
jgi:hypothetical protein